MAVQNVDILVIIGMMVVAASILALVARKFRQPLIFGYVIAGVLLGPSVTGLIADPGPIIWLSEMALIFLMFVIGLQLDMSHLKEVGKVSTIVGVVDVVVITLTGVLAGKFFGLTTVQSIYLGLVAAFSSTILVVKILEEKREIGSLTGELSIGVLIIEDILAVFALAVLGVFAGMKSSIPIPTLEDFFLSSMLAGMTPLMAMGTSMVVNGLLFVCVCYFFFRFVLPWIFKQIIDSNELVFIASLAMLFLFSVMAGFFTFSFAIGSFAAGILLNSTKYSHEIVSRVKPLKDFFLTLFFVVLGLQVTFTGIASQVAIIIYLLIGAVVMKPVFLFVLFKLFRYNNYTSFTTSIRLAQVSEFSLILVAFGVLAGALTPAFLTAAVVVAIISMMLSTYMMDYEQSLYAFARRFLDPFEKLFGTVPEQIRNVPDRYSPEAVVFGITPTTAEAIDVLKERKKLLVVDFNPSRITAYEKHGIPCICSDAIDIELYEAIDFSKCDIVISVIHDAVNTIHGPSSNSFLIRKIRAVNKHSVIIVTAQTEKEGERFYKAGATIVLTPSIMGKRILKEVISERDISKIRGMGLVFYEELHDELPFSDS